MQYCVDHPEEMNKISKIKSQVAEVKGIMMDNIEKVFGFIQGLPVDALSFGVGCVVFWPLDKTKYFICSPIALLLIGYQHLGILLQVLDRGTQIELLVDRTDQLRDQVQI